jgi:plasmid stability protein
MSALTIRNIDPQVKDHLRVAAALNNRSMEEEVRCILRQFMLKPAPSLGLGTRLNARFSAIGGINLDIPLRNNPARAALFDDSPTAP